MQHDAPQLGSGDGTTTTATITGTAYVCGEAPSESPAAPAKAAAPPPAKPEHPAPRGAAGFDFGKTEEQCAEICAGAKQEWANVAEDRFSCSGPANDLGLDASIVVGFCSHRTCGIQIEVRPAKDATGLEKQYAKLVSAQERKYGPARRKDRVTADCEKEPSVACYEDDKARRRASWRWNTGEHVVATLGDPEKGDGPVAIRLFYALDPEAQGVNPDAL